MPTQTTTSCDQIVANIPNHLSGMLDRIESQRLLDHCEACASCRKHLYVDLLERAADDGVEAVLLKPVPVGGDCFSQDTLRAFANDALTFEEAALVRQHLDSACILCKLSLETNG